MKYNSQDISQHLTEFMIDNYQGIDPLIIHSAVETIYLSTAKLLASSEADDQTRLYAKQQAKLVYETIFSLF